MGSNIIMIRAFILFSLLFLLTTAQKAQGAEPWWDIQSIDTVKYSRDVSREKLSDASYDQVIDTQVRNIAQTGATHVAIGTPYDEEFIPFLKRWVRAARKYNLNVWFRGNFSGWEQWFGYERITRDEHIEKTSSFIKNHPDLFADGDIFTPCPECENGGPGDPRQNGDRDGHRAFLTSLHNASVRAFASIGKDVRSGYFSMNGDVARLIMDPETTNALGGVVVIDHYVASPMRLADDIIAIAKQSGGRVILGEFGAPIPDIHGAMDESAQAKWISDALKELSRVPEVVGVNYWTNTGGSTQLWDGRGNSRQAVGVLSSYFQPHVIRGRIIDELSKPIENAIVATERRSTITDTNGNFTLFYLGNSSNISVSAVGYIDKNFTVNQDITNISQTLEKEQESFVFTLLKYIRRVLKPL